MVRDRGPSVTAEGELPTAVLKTRNGSSERCAGASAEHAAYVCTAECEMTFAATVRSLAAYHAASFASHAPAAMQPTGPEPGHTAELRSMANRAPPPSCQHRPAARHKTCKHRTQRYPRTGAGRLSVPSPTKSCACVSVVNTPHDTTSPLDVLLYAQSLLNLAATGPVDWTACVSPHRCRITAPLVWLALQVTHMGAEDPVTGIFLANLGEGEGEGA